MKQLTTLLFFLLFFFINKVIAQPGTIDSSFGNNGKVLMKLSSYGGSVRTSAVQQDKKIIVGVNISTSTLLSYSKIIRYQANGSIDLSFGENGISTIDSFECYDLKIASNGKILIYGSYYTLTSLRVIQLNLDGSIDSSFGNNGRTTFSFNLPQTNVGALTILSNSKIVVTIPSFGLMRIASNGIIDSSFGENGITVTNGKVGWGNNDNNQNSFTIKVQPDNKILVGGDYIYDNGKHFKFVIVRYTNNGVLDSSFGTDGKVISIFAQDTSNGNTINVMRKLDIQSSNKIVGGGIYHNTITLNDTFAMVRFNLNGKYDSSFAENGKSLINGALGASADLISFVLENDNKIFATGILSADRKGLVLTRYLTNGSTDASFGNNGYTITTFDTLYTEPTSINLQGSKIIVAGTSSNANGFYLTLIRYNNEAVLPVSLLSFNATKKDNSVLLNWQTINEINNNYFVVERTNNNRNHDWNALATIKQKGNDTKFSSYTYEDSYPLQSENYYRLKQVDKDGKFTYSQIAAVSFEDDNLIIAYPNPVANILNVGNLNPLILNNLEIINAKGTVVKKATTNEANYSWNIENIDKGIYYLRVNQNDKISIIKFLKK